MILGITGGTGCGKTTLLNLIKDMGGMVLDCDEIYHQLLKTDPPLLTAIENRVPGTVNGRELDRKKLGALVFSDENALLDLNRITHTAVKQEVLRRLAEKPKLAAIDAIGLFEGKLADLCDITVAVTAPTDDRVKRLMVRDGISENYAKKRIAAQHESDWFRQRCDYTLENREAIDTFKAECLAFLETLGIIKENQ